MGGSAAIDKKIALEVVGKRAVAILSGEFGLDGLASGTVCNECLVCVTVEVLGFGGAAFVFCFERGLAEKICEAYTDGLGGVECCDEATVLQSAFDFANIVVGNSVGELALSDSPVHIGVPKAASVTFEAFAECEKVTITTEFGSLSIGFVYLSE